MAADLTRGERLQIMLTEDELALVDDWRFKLRMPSRAAAVRELLKRGLAAEGFSLATSGTRSQDYGVGPSKSEGPSNGSASGNGSNGHSDRHANGAASPKSEET